MRTDIITKVSLLSSHVGLPREENLEAAVHVITHVGQIYNVRLVYESSYPEIDHSVFEQCDLSQLGKNAKEAISMKTPESQAKEVDTSIFVDSDDAGDKVSCRLRSGFLIYMNTTLVQWFSKK